MSTGHFVRLAPVVVFLAACGPDGGVPIEALPRGAADAGPGADVSPGGEDGQVGVAPSGVLREPEGRVEGAAATALREHASEAVLQVDAQTDLLTFVPMAGARPGAPVALTPSALTGWGSGPQAISLLAVDAGAAVVHRGLDTGLWADRVGTVLGTAETAGAFGRAQQALVAEAPINALYRIPLDGADAEAPRAFGRGLRLVEAPLFSSTRGEAYLVLEAGLAVLPAAPGGEPRVFRAPPADRTFSLIGVSESEGRLIVADRASDTLTLAWFTVFTLPLVDLNAEPTVLYRYPPPDPLGGPMGTYPRRLSDRWVLVQSAAAGQLVLDVSGERPPFLLPDDAHDEVRVVGDDRLVVPRSASNDGVIRPPRLYVQQLGADLAPDPVALDATPYAVNLARAVVTPDDDALLLGHESGLDRLPLDGGPRTTYPTVLERHQGTERVATDATGDTLLQVVLGPEGLGVMAAPRSGGPARVVVASAPETVAINVTAVAETGRIAVFRAGPEGTEVSSVSLDGTPGPLAPLLGRYRDSEAAPGGLVVRTRAGDQQLATPAAAAQSTLYSTPGALTLGRLAPGGAFAEVTDVRGHADRSHALVDLRRPAPPHRLDAEPAGWTVRAMRPDAVVVSRPGEGDRALGDTRLVPVGTDPEAARPYATGFAFERDLPALHGALFTQRDPNTDSLSAVFAPDDGSPAQPLALSLERHMLSTVAYTEPEADAIVAHFVGSTELIVRWRLGAADAPEQWALPGLRVDALTPLPETDAYLVAGAVDSEPGLWRLTFDGGPEPTLQRLAPAGIGLTASPLATSFFDRSHAFAAAGRGLLSADGARLLASGPQRVTVTGSVMFVGPLYILRTDGSDAQGVAPLLGGADVAVNMARLSPDAAVVAYTTPTLEGHVVAARPGAQTWPLCHVAPMDLAALTLRDPGAWAPALPRDGGRSLVCLDRSTGEVVRVNAETGERDLRATFDLPRGVAAPALLRLTPDEQAAIVAHTGPTGRRLYLVALEGSRAVARLSPDDAPADEAFVTFRP